jgi:spore coat polysaccharide biosynthesis protein SpsF
MCTVTSETTIAILQARMTSTRLPGKVMEPLSGAPMIQRQIERISRAKRLSGLVVATSVDPSDDELEAFVSRLGVPVVRGPLDDVLGRYVQAIDASDPSVVVRLTADCPLTSPVVIDAVIDSFFSGSYDYCSNTLQPSYPDGLDVEVVRSSVLRWVASNSTDPNEREHVTLGVYRRPERFALGNFAGDVDVSGLRWTVDTPEDLAFVRWVYSELFPSSPEFDLPDVLELLRAQPSLSRTTIDAARNAALEGLDTGAMNA